MAKTLLDEAIEDVQILKQSAIENAKNVLVEAMTPKIKQFVESQLGECGPGMGPSLSQAEAPLILKVVSPVGHQDESSMYKEADHTDDMQDVELMKNLGVLSKDDADEAEQEMSDKDDSSNDEDSSEEGDDSSDDEEKDVKETMDVQSEDLEMEAKDKENMDEVVEITNEDLKEALSQVLGSLTQEAKVTKGFGPVKDATLKASGGAGDKGIADEKSGEHHWKDETAPASKDWTVKEAKEYIKTLKEENASIKKEAAEYKKGFDLLRTKLQEVNLFNSKLLFTQKLLNLSELNDKQRINVVEAFDRAQTMREVELVYKSLSESFKIAGVLRESKKELASKAKSSRLSAPSATVLKEALVKEEKEATGSDFASRMQTLAGLTD